jgi:hypothetical protein
LQREEIEVGRQAEIVVEWREEGTREWRRRVIERELGMLLWLWKMKIEREFGGERCSGC